MSAKTERAVEYGRERVFRLRGALRPGLEEELFVAHRLLRIGQELLEGARAHLDQQGPEALPGIEGVSLEVRRPQHERRGLEEVRRALVLERVPAEQPDANDPDVDRLGRCRLVGEREHRDGVADLYP